MIITSRKRGLIIKAAMLNGIKVDYQSRKAERHHNRIAINAAGYISWIPNAIRLNGST